MSGAPCPSKLFCAFLCDCIYEALTRVAVGGKFAGALTDRMFQRRSCQGSSLRTITQNAWGNSKPTPRPNCKRAPPGAPQVHRSLRHTSGFVLITKFSRHSSSNSPGPGGPSISANAGAKVYPSTKVYPIPFPPFRRDTPLNPTEPNISAPPKGLSPPPPHTPVPPSFHPGGGEGRGGEVFLLASGGVDSTVCAWLLHDALGPNQGGPGPKEKKTPSNSTGVPPPTHPRISGVTLPTFLRGLRADP